MIYKLSYSNRKEAILDLIAKEVIDIKENYINGTQAVVYLGFLVLQQGTYDIKGLETTPAIIDTNYSVDLMSTNEIEFTNLITPNNPRHGFSGN
jgi:hypothetical protein